METLQTTSPHTARRKLIKDPAAYIEAIGKHDIPVLSEILEESAGEGTAIRLFFGATRAMPLRALSYLTSAARLAALLPNQQLQVICTSTVGEQVNGIPQEEAAKQFALLQKFGSHLLEKTMPHILEKTIFAHDTPTPLIETLQPFIREALAANSALHASLQSKGKKHGADFASYGAAHVAYQDTAILKLAVNGAAEPIATERIATIGCQQERIFYALRMATRSLVSQELLVPSLQVFTEHVSPPYYIARHGEPLLEEAARNRELQFSARDQAANRDLQHFETVINPPRSH